MMRTIDRSVWEGGTTRAGRPFLGEIAEQYEDLRPCYPPQLVATVLAYAGGARHAVEVGAGTGKATAAFVQAGLTVDCVEPDPEMAGVLRRRLETNAVVVHETAFESWRMPDPVPLIYSAQAWHWLNPQTRCVTAWRALAPGGTLALFGHRYLLADEAIEARVDEVYLMHAPALLGDASVRHLPARQYWYADELAQGGLFENVETADFHHVVLYDADTFVRLTQTFSSHRILSSAELSGLLEGLRAALADVGEIPVDLATVLALGRRPGLKP